MYLRWSVIEHGCVPSADMYDFRKPKLAFPRVVYRNAPMLEPVVQLLRQPALLFACSVDGINKLPTFNTNTKLYFSSSAVCHHLRFTERGARDCKKYGVGAKKHSRAADSRLAHGCWWQLIADDGVRDHLVRLLSSDSLHFLHFQLCPRIWPSLQCDEGWCTHWR